MDQRQDVHFPDQLWWPEQGIEKVDAVEWYRAIAPAILPHLRDRPFTMKRHYNGPRSPFSWEKDAPAGLRTGSRRARCRPGRGAAASSTTRS